ncbi:hypothetical protein GIB67_032691 [Kingdonia uniflora]|uniref:Receptor-like serine/threonine-protein kinase n=1 Tax=Kingdonia uniflora TaxID=39325 RepID=A0A7J7MW56_9MAGN|nr:hypothetical protein GIB67_032691 [Kingdonia uniflora]
MEGAFLFVFLSTLQIFLSKCLASTDTLSQSQSILNNQTLVSASESFKLGFFSPSNSSMNRYLGIWFNKISNRTVVWVANRNHPLTDSSGILKLNENRNLVLLNGTNSVIWSSSSSEHTKADDPVIVQLLDSGNLVLRYESNNDPENYIWQSFDYPLDSLIPGMKLGRNLETGFSRNLTSWKNDNDPSPGDFTGWIDPRGFPQLVVNQGSIRVGRAGPWNGVRFSGSPELNSHPVFKPFFVFNKEEVYTGFERTSNSIISRFVMDQSGVLQLRTWNEHKLEWTVLQTVQKDRCDNYGVCGAYGLCNINNSPVCSCLEGFKPKSQEDWDQMDWSGGCTLKTKLDCLNGDGFVKVTSMKLPDTSESILNVSMNHNECRTECLKNCSCVAYANSDIREGGSGCVMWFSDLVDIKKFPVNGQDLYLRMAASELGRMGDSGKKSRQTAVMISASIVLGILISGLAFWLIIWRQRGKDQNNLCEENTDEIQKNELELPTFDFLTIATATNNFSCNNKLGEGGFGPVYKGKLVNGQEIAVKKLSKKSGQGIHEFQNEVILIAKLQHRNLVRLLGCCIQRHETMLIYEYMPNKSLDSFIFDQARSTLINWEKRFNIIIGIAQGLLYLHRDSRLRIIHRDLKASNVLLDEAMKPKISDFGMARTFGGDQIEENTDRVVGTYGYMAPEYAIDGLFSVKSDVFSFGVLVLEIVSGKKNRGFEHRDHDLNLLGHAWKLWKEGTALKLIDTSIEDSLQTSEVLRCIHVGLLCVQQRPDDRPNMPYVVLMLSSETVSLPQPNQPGFYNERSLVEVDSSSSGKMFSSNEITFTSIQGR